SSSPFPKLTLAVGAFARVFIMLRTLVAATITDVAGAGCIAVILDELKRLVIEKRWPLRLLGAHPVPKILPAKCSAIRMACVISFSQPGVSPRRTRYMQPSQESATSGPPRLLGVIVARRRAAT